MPHARRLPPACCTLSGDALADEPPLAPAPGAPAAPRPPAAGLGITSKLSQRAANGTRAGLPPALPSPTTSTAAAAGTAFSLQLPPVGSASAAGAAGAQFSLLGSAAPPAGAPAAPALGPRGRSPPAGRGGVTRAVRNSVSWYSPRASPGASSGAVSPATLRAGGAAAIGRVMNSVSS
jgi:hypothetical protein